MANWSFLTSHARVLTCIAHDPGARLRDIAASRLPGGLIEFRAPPGGADELGPEPIGQRPRGEGPGPGTAPGVPADPERATAVPAAPDRIDPHIEHVHGNLPVDKRSVLHRVGPAIEPEAAAVRRTRHQPPMLSMTAGIPSHTGLPFHGTTSTQGDKAKGTRDSTPRAPNDYALPVDGEFAAAERHGTASSGAACPALSFSCTSVALPTAPRARSQVHARGGHTEYGNDRRPQAGLLCRRDFALRGTPPGVGTGPVMTVTPIM